MKNNRTRFACIAPLACAATLAILASCSSGTDAPPAPKTVVYAAGSYSEGGYDLPCYWRDGTRVALPYYEEAGRVAAIAVNGGTVYTAGSTGYHDYYSCYWAGTERTDLTGGGASAIGIEGVTVYAIVNGDWSTEEITAFGGAYYAGTAFNRLTGIASGNPDRPQYDTGANDIAVVGGTVYTAGYASDDTGTNACYWTGPDARTSLDASAEAMAIFVSGATIYTAGRYYGGGSSVPCYWSGTDRTDLPIPASAEEGGAEGIAVADGIVYAAGYHGYYDEPSYNYAYTACYWVDGVRTDLVGEGTNSAQACAIRVFEDSVYIAGFYSDGSKDIPCYWKDGVRVDLPGGTGGYANDIVVVKE